MRAASLILLILMAGCSVGPKYTRPDMPAPGSFANWQGGDASLHDAKLRSNQAPVPERWWETFNDPALNELEAKARTANPDLQTAALRFAQSRAQRRAIAAERGPQLNANAGANRNRESEHGASTRLINAIAPAQSSKVVQILSSPYNFFQAGFDASWELDLWGQVRRSVESADADAAGAGAALDGVRLGIAAEVARNYFELGRLHTQIELMRADLAGATETLELVQARANGGVTSDLDAARERALLADLQAQLPQLLQQQARTLSQLGLLLGTQPGALQNLLNATPNVPTLPDLALGLPSELARRRPDIRQAEEKLHSVTATIGIAVADLYPRITLAGSFGFESIAAGELGDWASRHWTLGPTLTIPIFDMRRRRSVVTLRKLQQQEAAVAYQKTVLQAWHEIDTALSAYTAERQRNQHTIEREHESREVYQLAHMRYQNGITSYLDDLEAQRGLFAAQRASADSNAQLAIDLVAIYKALGGAAL